MPAANRRLAKVAVQCSAETFVVNRSLVLRINICGKNRRLRQAPNVSDKARMTLYRNKKTLYQLTMRQICLTLFLAASLFSSCKGQDNRISEIPFTLDKRLLVFKGQLNGIETNFAFDTGAAEGIASSNEENSKGIERTSSTQRISDGNGKIGYLQTGITKELSIGVFKFQNVRASITNMQYLQCMNLYLLGADIIRQLNWEIDFKKLTLKVSKNSFETTTSMQVIPVSYEFNTTRTKLKINSIHFKNVLIDFGYTGVMEIPAKKSNVKQYIDERKSKNLIETSIASNFAVAGMSKPTIVEKTLLDSININGNEFYNIPVEFKEITDFKIGLSFFSSTCDIVIINNNDKKFYLQLKKENEFTSTFPISVIMKDGKLKIITTSISDTSIANNFAIEEEIKAINGKSAIDFKSECDYLNWFYLTKWDKLHIRKLNGNEIDVRRSPNR